MGYTIDCANGTKLGSYETYQDAIAACQAEWPGAVIGHDGDLQDGGDRTLVWACEADSIDDDGRRAVASICFECSHQSENPCAACEYADCCGEPPGIPRGNCPRCGEPDVCLECGRGLPYHDN